MSDEMDELAELRKRIDLECAIVAREGGYIVEAELLPSVFPVHETREKAIMREAARRVLGDEWQYRIVADITGKPHLQIMWRNSPPPPPPWEQGQ